MVFPPRPTAITGGGNGLFGFFKGNRQGPRRARSPGSGTASFRGSGSVTFCKRGGSGANRARTNALGSAKATSANQVPFGPLGQFWASVDRGLRERVLGQSHFVTTLMVEGAITLGSQLVAEHGKANLRLRDDEQMGTKIANASLGLATQLLVVYCLASRRQLGPPPSGGMLASLNSLPAHAFQKGAYSGEQRVLSLLWRGVQLSGLGLASGWIASKVENSARTRERKERRLREVGPKDFKAKQVSWPGDLEVNRVALLHGAFFATSVNLRYHIVNAIEDAFLFPAFSSPALRTGAQFLWRLSNHYIAGRQWQGFANKFELEDPQTVRVNNETEDVVKPSSFVLGKGTVSGKQFSSSQK